MSEHEPVEEVQHTLEDAAKLRDMIRHPGWTEVVLPYLNSVVEGYTNQLVITPWESLDAMKACQNRIMAIEEFLFVINNTISQADAIVKEEALKMEKQGNEA